jgi:YHS domain-containing protein
MRDTTPQPAAPRSCVVCKQTLGEGALRLRYEGRMYEFDKARCKLIFQENPDRWLDAFGGVLDKPR